MKIICVYCDEEILPEEKFPWFHPNLPCVHRECHIRMIVGSVAHQKRKCSCFGGSHIHENKILTIRQNAKAAMDYFLDIQNKIASAKFN